MKDVVFSSLRNQKYILEKKNQLIGGGAENVKTLKFKNVRKKIKIDSVYVYIFYIIIIQICVIVILLLMLDAPAG